MSAKKKSEDNKKLEIDAKRLTDLLLRADHVDTKSFYIQSFLRGLLTGAGGVIGATVLVAVLLWLLSLFDTVPLVGPLLENTRSTIEQR